MVSTHSIQVPPALCVIFQTNRACALTTQCYLYDILLHDLRHVSLPEVIFTPTDYRPLYV